MNHHKNYNNKKPLWFRLIMLIGISVFLACTDSADNTPTITADRVPSSPQSVTATIGTGGLTISWEAPADAGIVGGDGTEGTITGYKVYYSQTADFALSDSGVSVEEVVGTTHTITGLLNDTPYYLVVTALNATGESAPSSHITGTPTLPFLSGWREYNQNNPITKSTTGTAIGTLEELKAMTVDGEYHLTADIDLGTENWAPLHTAAAPFTGTLHGNGYIVYGLNINAPEANYQGLFAALNGATINNLGIGVKSIIANVLAGGLAGYAENSTLSNVAAGGTDTESAISVDGDFRTITSKVDGFGGFTGGLVGYLAAGGSMTDGWNEGLAVRATGDGGRIGGLVGRALSSVTGTSSGDVSSSGSGYDVGGLVGSTTASVTGTASGNVSAGSGGSVGGLVGDVVGSTVTGFASGNVSSGSGEHVGGLVGSVDVSVVTGSASGNVSSVSGQNVGGLVGNLTSFGVGAASARGTASGNVSSVSGHSVGGLVGYANGSVTGAASGNVSSESGQSIGGLVGGRGGGDILGYSIGWVMTGKDSTQTTVGAVIGVTLSTHNVYYNSEGGDHVGTIGEASATKINETVTGATGERGTSNHGTGIQGIANATAANMGDLTAGTEVGQWIFTAGQWPKLNLPAEVTDYMDYTTSPSAPANFVD